ncbi:DeoR/GlpR transcriptional regulator [Spiractinospora alimapuensis]|uniref:DeoR/GlpR family DNA-binding transcription regulator n=1 Tax=Spiractinospora alimapuensis TaxID=2820884 RepID=UPI001F3B806F|nr:DeoR/GlpR family DNA-binding transcription regulator [Spiractinospora alimapuensis]QVQ54004.1 DeoR/GlpR transcriptional regulator [Spiractinospora alimapuensis]
MPRHQRLYDAVVDGVHRVDDLAALLAVSPSTVRRVLAELERAGKVVRTHGGALPLGAGTELSVAQKSRQHATAKRRIAERAVDMVARLDLGRSPTVLLDAGSTTTYIAEKLASSASPLSVITTGTGPLWALCEAEGVEVTVAGGRLRHRRGSFVGDLVREALDRVTPDIAFIGADGLVPTLGISCRSAELAEVKELQCRRATCVVVVADASKIGAEPFPHWARLPDAYQVITDDTLTTEGRTALADDPRCAPITVRRPEGSAGAA